MDHPCPGMLNVLILGRIVYNPVALTRGITLCSDDNRCVPWLRLLQLFHIGLVAATRGDTFQRTHKTIVVATPHPGEA